jgi:tRNA pseudouridine38-40 synthase
MSRYRIDLQYEGTRYFGWQRQSHQHTLQAEVEGAVSKFLREKVGVLAASRTDTGVHAEHQVALFAASAQVKFKSFLKSVNAILPQDIRIFSITKVPETFHPIHAAKSKMYRYRIWLHGKPPPFLAPYCWSLRRQCDLDLLKSCLEALRGTHDFTAFCASDSSAKTKTRTIYHVGVRQNGPMIEILLWGNGFLKQMCRSIVGTAIDSSSGKRDKGLIKELLLNPERIKVGQTAPAQGLCLSRIIYEDDFSLDEYLSETTNSSHWCPPAFHGPMD